MPYGTNWAECPCCKVNVQGKDNIDQVFGYRKVRGKIIPQSYCRKCRSAGCTAIKAKH